MTTTTRCASPSATRPASAISPSSVAVSTARSGTASAPPRARSSSPGKTVAHRGHWAGAFPGRHLQPRHAGRVPRRRPSTEDGALTNADEAIGELVNTTGAGLFAGYYNDPEATDARVRHGMFWSGDLAYQDADGWIYFAGRSGDWLRVDGENMTTAPIERILQRLTPISQVAVYAVPDEHVGDQVMAAIVLERQRRSDAGGVRPVSGRPARSVAQGVAPLCLAHRSAADHGDQQDPQAGADRPRRARPRAALSGRATGEAGPTRRPDAAALERTPDSPGMRVRISVFGDGGG